MTSGYDARGRRVGATIVEIQPNWVTQIKTIEGKDKYNSVQIGLGEKKSVKKPQIGHLKKAGIDKKVRFLREIRTDETNLEPGTEVKLNQVFSIGDALKVTGISKGRGFQGGVRRHGFHGGPKTHGQSDRHRAPGSIGSGTTPGRVYKGKKMAGHMGVETVSVRNLEVIGLDKDSNLLTIKGGIPGVWGSLLTITKLGRIKGYTPPPEEKADEEEETSVVSSKQSLPSSEQNEQATESGEQTESPIDGETKDAS